MSLLHDAYTALLAGLTHKTGNEIHWYDEYNNPITIEPIDIENERYIVKWYFNGKKVSEAEYQNDKRHGKAIGWYENGQKYAELEYQNDLLHGECSWWRGTQIHYKTKYQNGYIIEEYYEHIT